MDVDLGMIGFVVMSQKTQKQTIGKTGEDIATRFLVKQGFVVVERNYLKKFGEIDIICKKNGKTHFIEVKSVSRETSLAPNGDEAVEQGVSRETSDEYRPEDNIHSAKLKRIGRTIEAYLNEKDISDDWEFHAITVLLNDDKKTAKVRFLKNLVIESL